MQTALSIAVDALAYGMALFIICIGLSLTMGLMRVVNLARALEEAAYALGFDHIAAGPLVRSSYHADQHVPQDRPGVGPLAAAGA